jgi:hypothetical protein
MEPPQDLLPLLKAKLESTNTEIIALQVRRGANCVPHALRDCSWPSVAPCPAVQAVHHLGCNTCGAMPKLTLLRRARTTPGSDGTSAEGFQRPLFDVHNRYVQAEMVRIRERLDNKLKHAPKRPTLDAAGLEDRIEVSELQGSAV